MAPTSQPQSEFDTYADLYKEELSHLCRRLVNPQDNYFVNLKCNELRSLLNENAVDVRALTVADIGCGIGDFERRLAEKFRRLYAFDLSLPMIHAAQRQAPFVGGGYVCADSLALPLVDASVDVVFASCLLHHITRVAPVAVLAEFSRICRPGGLVVCFEHNPFHPVTQLVVRTTPIDRSAKLLSSDALPQAFVRVGLVNVAHRYILFAPKVIDCQLRRFHPWLQRIPLGAQYLVLGHKPG